MPASLDIDAPARTWAPPEGVRVRGTIALIAGGNETARVYERFGRRIGSDGYVVAFFATADAADAAAWLAAQPDAPRVLAGSDRGAAAALTVAVSQTRRSAPNSEPEASDIRVSRDSPSSVTGVDGVLVAGLPLGDADDASATAEQRTACPVHLGVLAGETARADTTDETVEVPDAATLAHLDVPVLAVHGGADPLSPFALVRARLSALPRAELVETVDGLHDALNDQSHRSVAATVVLWLERLRTGDVDAPIIREGRA